MSLRIWQWLGLLLIATPALADEWVYTMRPGDDLWSIAQTYCGSTSAAKQIAEHNGITDNTAVRAGQRINIPTQLLTFEPSTAVVLEVNGEVQISRRAVISSANHQPGLGAGLGAGLGEGGVKTGDELDMGDRLITKEGSVLIRFADGSTLSISPNSSVMFNKLTAFGPAGMVDTHLRFAYGRGKATVQPQNRGDRFRIQTPEGVAAVRGTQFRVGHTVSDDTSVSTTETLEGEVAYIRSDSTTPIPAGTGLVASAAGVIRETLLPAPQWLDQATSAPAGTELEWQPVAGAASYVSTWTSAKRPEIILSEAFTTAPAALINVSPGDYVFRVHAVSANAISGFDAQRAYQIKQLAPSLARISTEVAGPVAFEWEYPTTTTGYTLTLDADHWDAPRQHSTTTPTLQTDLPAGVYQWSVQAAESSPAASNEFILLPTTPNGLVVKNKQKILQISWQAEAPHERYLIRLIPTGNNAGAPIERTVEGGSAEIEVPRFGHYKLQLASIQNSLQSEPVTHKVQVNQRPWWLTLLIPLLIL